MISIALPVEFGLAVMVSILRDWFSYERPIDVDEMSSGKSYSSEVRTSLRSSKSKWFRGSIGGILVRFCEEIRISSIIESLKEGES